MPHVVKRPTTDLKKDPRHGGQFGGSAPGLHGNLSDAEVEDSSRSRHGGMMHRDGMFPLMD